MARRDTSETKARIVQYIQTGHTVEEACRLVGKSQQTYEYYRRTDKEFKDKIDLIRAATNKSIAESADSKQIPFAEFREKYLGSKTFPHQQNIVDLLEDRDPTWVHSGMTFERGENPDYILVNMPPEHAKSMTISIDYVTYRVALNPNIRVKIVSKNMDLAKHFLGAIKQRLTHPNYSDLQVTYAPGVGFKSKSAVWREDQIFFGQELRDSNEADPTIQALGMGGHIYGTRADLMILDDTVTLSNAHEYEKQIRWIQQEVITRLGPGGKVLILGTRVDAKDLYRELRNPERYQEGQPPWTYLAMPALLEVNEDPDKWLTLWPKSDEPWPGLKDQAPDDEGLFVRWDGIRLKRRRSAMDPRTWNMVYQQADVDDDAIFPPVAVKGSVDRMRMPGVITPGMPGAPESTEGFYIVAGLDPAIVGYTAAVVMAVDRKGHKRWILDCAALLSPSPAQIRGLIQDWTTKYRPQEWMVERNAFQGYLTQDENLRSWLASQGVFLREHTTSKNKWDAGFGVAAMAPLFGTVQADGKHHRDNLIHLPADRTEAVRMLIDQLITWSPTTKGKTDLVMALWFCEIRARELLQHSIGVKHHMNNSYLSRNEQAKRMVVNLDEVLNSPQRI